MLKRVPTDGEVGRVTTAAAIAFIAWFCLRSARLRFLYAIHVKSGAAAGESPRGDGKCRDFR